MKLRSLEVLREPNRSAAIDFYRGIAIISVVLFHFEPYFPFGYLGVELFFVISGFLVGGILIEKYKAGKIKYWEFILQRGFKIWPSFYFFLIVGNIIAYFLYRDSHPDGYIPLADMKRYLLFYRNYTGFPDHWNFDHTWSLCVEEHFYILFPLALIVLLTIAKPSPGKLNFIIFSMIALGFIFKTLTIYYTNGKDTISPTHNKIDSLAYGILLYQAINYFKTREGVNKRWLFALGGMLLLPATLFVNVHFHNIFFDAVVLWTLVPLAFALIIFGTYHFSFRYFKAIRFIAYYSYNLYLWHTIFVYFSYDKFGAGIAGLLFYLVCSFTTAFLTTILIEEYFLSRRKHLISSILKSRFHTKKT
jgi:peptidoglycan/LPS O-acetylase OafA/YrhL